MSIAYTTSDTLLKIDHVSLSYGDKVILRDVSAEVKNIERADCIQGQVVAFLGPSGIGKTQLSRCIAGLQMPTSGVVTLAHPVSAAVHKDAKYMVPVHAGDVGMVAQNYPLFDFTTVEDNLMIAGRQISTATPRLPGLRAALEASKRPSPLREKAHDLMNQFDLYQYRDYYPCHLSGGTRQRVAIIRQLMCAGHFLVLDEPFSGLDLIMKQKACDLITRVADLDDLNTIIIVTHDVTEGLSIADTAWLMGQEPGLPGARIVEMYDMAKDGICWEPGLTTNSHFMQFVAQVKERFKTLKIAG